MLGEPAFRGFMCGFGGFLKGLLEAFYKGSMQFRVSGLGVSGLGVLGFLKGLL